MEKIFVLESKVSELELEVQKLKLENARLKCRLLAIASEHDISLPEDLLKALKSPSNGLRIEES